MTIHYTATDDRDIRVPAGLRLLGVRVNGVPLAIARTTRAGDTVAVEVADPGVIADVILGLRPLAS